MQHMETKTKDKADIKRLNHIMTVEQKSKAIKAAGVLTAKSGKVFSVQDAINYLFEKGYDALDIDKSVA
jgi:hypothetical protein